MKTNPLHVTTVMMRKVKQPSEAVATLLEACCKFIGYCLSPITRLGECTYSSHNRQPNQTMCCVEHLATIKSKPIECVQRNYQQTRSKPFLRKWHYFGWTAVIFHNRVDAHHRCFYEEVHSTKVGKISEVSKARWNTSSLKETIIIEIEAILGLWYVRVSLNLFFME